jgi:hypothetical protein
MLIAQDRVVVVVVVVVVFETKKSFVERCTS